MDFSFEAGFAATRVLAILRGLGAEASLALAGTLWDAGLTALEVPMQHPSDVDTLAALATAARARGLVVGAGTIVRPEQVAEAASAGAAYTVSPGVDPEVIRASLDAGLPTLPGVATPTDIQRCQRLGLSWLKAFPAVSLGPEWFRAMRGPFPDVRLVATGGVRVETASDFLAAGARVVSLGSALSDPTQLAKIAMIMS